MIAEQRQYKCLKEQIFAHHVYTLVPIRSHDRYLIRKWRNEQIDILRQKEPLSAADQDRYFESVIAPSFRAKQPDQILFSMTKSHDLVGYGGLVHINWSDKNAEISFLLDTAYNSSPENFKRLWTVYLELLPKIAFEQLHFKKIYTYAYETRTILFPILEENGFVEEARLKQHALVNGEYKDVIIHSLFNPQR